MSARGYTFRKTSEDLAPITQHKILKALNKISNDIVHSEGNDLINTLLQLIVAIILIAIQCSLQ